jgi:hypothetical protein
MIGSIFSLLIERLPVLLSILIILSDLLYNLSSYRLADAALCGSSLFHPASSSRSERPNKRFREAETRLTPALLYTK